MQQSSEVRANTLGQINQLLEEQIQSQAEEIEVQRKDLEYWKNHRYRYTKNKINQTIATKRASEYVQTDDISK